MVSSRIRPPKTLLRYIRTHLTITCCKWWSLSPPAVFVVSPSERSPSKQNGFGINSFLFLHAHGVCHLALMPHHKCHSLHWGLFFLCAPDLNLALFLSKSFIQELLYGIIYLLLSCNPREEEQNSPVWLGGWIREWQRPHDSQKTFAYKFTLTLG